jgi:flavin-dependent dehydrogenase
LWGKTRFVSSLFGEATFTERLAPLNASGGRLDRFHGEGWLCCGDAALSFDPLSSLGMLTAIYGGMLAGNMVLKTLGNESAIDADYGERLNSIRAAYRVNLVRAYREERRWQRQDFWQTHQEMSMTE